ncbi:MAG: cytochrome b [Pseudomonadota bacterium]
MSARNTSTAWGWPARIVHWLMALMIVAMLGFGTYMSNNVDDLIQQFEMVQQHKSVGFLVFSLAVLRVIWRLVNPTPALPQDMPGWQVRASHASHVLLYVLMFAMPITGWLMSSASPLNDEGAYPIQVKNMVFGLFEMPDPFPTGSQALSEALHTAHWLCAMALVALLLVHVAAALKHHIVDRDAVLRRMLSGRG